MLLNTEQLSQWCGYTRKSDIVRWLKDNGIQYTIGKDGEVCTTLDAINAGLLGTSGRQKARFGHGPQAA
jgi:hypothetical protein